MQAKVTRAWFWQVFAVCDIDALNTWSNWTIGKWLRLLLCRSVWLLRTDGRVSGFMVVEVAANKAAVTNFFVLPQYRGKGWGRQLMCHVLTKLPSKVTRVDLETRSSNRRLRDFYHRIGFRRQCWIDDFYVTPSGRTEPAWQMSLCLDEAWRLGQDSNLRPIP